MKLILGLPHLSQGALYQAAAGLRAPVMVSASCLGKWRSIEHKGKRAREWQGWNTRPLDRVDPAIMEVHLDSAGFVAMAVRGGYDWTPESYIEDLVAHPAVSRASSMDLCVEREIAGDRGMVKERIAKTINLNYRCHRIASDLGIDHKLMAVIQGDTVDDYLACFEAIQPLIRHGATIGVGSMCRRPTGGRTGALTIVSALHDQLPSDIQLHLFGVKSDAAEAMSGFGSRIASVDSQAYGTRARMQAGQIRKTNPQFSKSDHFVAQVMSDWYQRQSIRLANPRAATIQQDLSFASEAVHATVLDAVEQQVRDEFNDLIADGQLEHDQIIGGRMLEEAVMERLGELPDGVRATDKWHGNWQLPAIKTLH